MGILDTELVKIAKDYLTHTGPNPDAALASRIGALPNDAKNFGYSYNWKNSAAAKRFGVDANGLPMATKEAAKVSSLEAIVGVNGESPLSAALEKIADLTGKSSDVADAIKNNPLIAKNKPEVEKILGLSKGEHQRAVSALQGTLEDLQTKLNKVYTDALKKPPVVNGTALTAEQITERYTSVAEKLVEPVTKRLELHEASLEHINGIVEKFKTAGVELDVGKYAKQEIKNLEKAAATIEKDAKGATAGTWAGAIIGTGLGLHGVYGLVTDMSSGSKPEEERPGMGSVVFHAAETVVGAILGVKSFGKIAGGNAQKMISVAERAHLVP